MNKKDYEIITSSSIVNAQTIGQRCPAGTALVSGTSKCCPSYFIENKSVKATSIDNSNRYRYFNTKNKTGSICLIKSSDCTSGYAKDMTPQKTYTTTVYFQHSWGWGYITRVCTQAECQWIEQYSECPSGTYFAGWQQVSGRGYTDGSFVQTTSDATANYTLTVKALCNYNKPPVTTTGTETEEESKQIEEPVEEVCPASDNKEKITNINNYKITYNLDGGHFIDGSTERTEIISSSSTIGVLRLNPLKDGYKFISWQENGKDFDFSQKASRDVKLTAKYEKLTDEEKDRYTCPNDYILDPSNAKCYKYLKFNREGTTTSNSKIDNIMQVPYQTNQTPSSSTAYNYTKVSYTNDSRMCYGYNYPNEGDPGAISYIKDGPIAITGKNNATYYFTENGKNIEYEDQDWWKSEDNCNFGSSCNVDQCTKIEGACNITYSAIIFHSINVTYAKELDTTEIVEDNDNNNEDNNIKDDNVSDNPKTGSKLWIFIILGVSFSAVGTYYYRKYKKVEENSNI